ncbi:hypothetical protein GobsT_18490 [Gemmata obscuriglobus]|uniref:hypothetical protein n=1 Tax=Gemmata obscuriglobus TaxID=114 RepID=UPI0011CD2B13|nr:hypothetical protein [Gemmata obscuriglobus]QEG27096.1 hypothetical protein GobsT_18490 [Gemmata obscuriglobus]VTS03583.1 unnamed protein product [Gemmata obscuriglobus UQM 2246]
MALQLTGQYETNYGTTVDSTYWRWIGLGIDVSRNQGTVTLYAYVSKEAYETGKQPIGDRQYQVTGPGFAALANQMDGPQPLGISNPIYSYIKANDVYFAAAVEV